MKDWGLAGSMVSRIGDLVHLKALTLFYKMGLIGKISGKISHDGVPL